MKSELTTARLRLVTLDESHAAQVLAYFKRNRSYLQAWEPARTPEFFTLDAQKDLLANDRTAMEWGQLFKVWVYEKDGPERVIGSIAVSNIVRGAFQSGHLGYRLDCEANGRGYMTEALRAVIDYAFFSLLLHRLEANVMPRNRASNRVVEKLGFEREGLARRYLKINGKWEDHIHWVALNEAME